MRAAKGRARVPAGGAGGLLRLRWPVGRREVAETAGVLPAGRLGSSRVRFVSPSGVVEAEATAAPWNKSSRSLPSLVGVPLRRRRRGRGGGVRFHRLLLRSLRRLLLCRCGGVAVLVPRSCLGAEVAVGAVDGGRAGRPRLPFGSGRWRASIRDLRSLGRVPGRRSFNGVFVPAFVLGIYCGSIKPVGDGASSDRGRLAMATAAAAAASSDGAAGWGKGPGTCLQFLFLLWPFSQSVVDSSPLYPGCICICTVHVCFP